MERGRPTRLHGFTSRAVGVFGAMYVSALVTLPAKKLNMHSRKINNHNMIRDLVSLLMTLLWWRLPASSTLGNPPLCEFRLPGRSRSLSFSIHLADVARAWITTSSAESITAAAVPQPLNIEGPAISTRPALRGVTAFPAFPAHETRNLSLTHNRLRRLWPL
jgi:hypothetical protein